VKERKGLAIAERREAVVIGPSRRYLRRELPATKSPRVSSAVTKPHQWFPLRLGRSRSCCRVVPAVCCPATNVASPLHLVARFTILRRAETTETALRYCRRRQLLPPSLATLPSPVGKVRNSAPVTDIGLASIIRSSRDPSLNRPFQ
jgi:hypothetical protein